MPDQDRSSESSQTRQRAVPLAASELRFQALFEQAVVGMVVVDARGAVVSVNDAFCKMVDRPAAEITGRDSSHYSHPDDREANVARIARVRIDGNDRITFEKRYLRPDSSVVWAQVNLSPLLDESRAFVGMIGVIEDVTDRRRTDLLVRESEARLKFLAELDERTRDLVEPEAVMAISAQLLGQRLRASRCAYAEVEPDEDRFTIRHDYVDGTLSTVGTYFLSLFGPRAAAMQRAGRTLVFRDVDHELSPLAGGDEIDDQGAAMFNAIGIKAIVCCPLVRGGRLVAMMAVHQSTPRDWSADEIALVEAVVERSWSYLERARTARVLRERDARLGDIVRTALDCIVGMDEHGRVTEWNPAAELTFGYSRDEAVGAEMAALIIPPAMREMHRAGLRRYVATGEAKVLGRRLELVAVRRDASEFPVELTITANTLTARPSFTGYVRDITDRRRAERERESLLQSERAARNDAERASQMKDEFLATLSHELRTPLNAILGWAQIVRRPAAKPADIAQGLEVIERNARTQAQIIEDLLDMSRIVSGKVRLDVQRVDLAQVALAALDTARPAADAKGIRLQSVIDPLCDVVIKGDAGRLQQVLWNLLANAIKFTPKAGRVQVLVECVNSHLELSVTDTGEGIRADFLPHVFDRFRQADASTTRAHGGLGLGLSIVKQLVELHGGTVNAKSAGPGRGSTFTVMLPLMAMQVRHDEVDDPRVHPRVENLASNLEPQRGPNLSHVRVLVVDDEVDARTLLKRLLEDDGATVLTASSASEAIESLRLNSPDVLISDIGMPDKDGYALIRHVRAQRPEHGGSLPSLALTAFARTDDRVRAIVAGFNMHIAKPVEPAELLASVASLAQRSRRASE